MPQWDASKFRAHETIRRTVEQRFGEARVLVVGDLMLDVYLRGDVARISPEAPVPVVQLSRRSETPGGAGNVLLNLAALGLRVTAAGIVGDDDAGRRLRSLLAEAGVETGPVVALAGRPTVTKTRVIGGHQQMIRIDEETSEPVPEADLDRLLGAGWGGPRLEELVAAVVLSDYAKGTLPERVCQALIAVARRRGVPVLVDPKGRDFGKYAGATALTPNLHELELAIGRGPLAEPALHDAAQRLRRELGLDFLVVTRGEKGLSLFDEGGASDFPAVAREVFDVSGAGDTIIATLTAGLVAGLDRDEALKLANLAAGIVVGKVGTTPVQRDDLLGALAADTFGVPSSKVCALATLVERVAGWRDCGERIVFTNGCFDLLHVGHVTLLARARAEGDRLIVGLNTDRSVRSLKGEGRPVIHQEDRAQVLAGLSSVDAVVLFDEPTPQSLIETLRPDVLVKGADYTEAQVAGAEAIKSWGGKVVLVPLLEGRSTTRILGR
jgi:D-beta-D-heptose 7-phosphate kinase/D-beta-D-heptose 1-phosphate adenosyltransferase